MNTYQQKLQQGLKKKLPEVDQVEYKIWCLMQGLLPFINMIGRMPLVTNIFILTGTV